MHTNVKTTLTSRKRSSNTMKRISKFYAIMCLVIAGIGTTYVVGQSNELPRIDQQPRRMRGTLPPITAAPSQNGQEASMPLYQPLGNANSSAAVAAHQSSGIAQAATQSPAQNTSRMRLVSHNTEDDNAAQPVSAVFQQPPANTGNVPAIGSQNQHIGTMPVNGNGNWGKENDVPEHVLQGISQLREPLPQSQPSASDDIPSRIAPTLDMLPPSAVPSDVTVPNTPSLSAVAPHNASGTEIPATPEGLIPFRPIQPLTSENEVANVPQNNASPSDGASNNGDEPRSKVRMSFGGVPHAPGNTLATPAVIPPSQVAPVTELIARNNSSVDVRYDGNSVQLGNMAEGSFDSSSEGTGLPGSSELAGVQVPQLVIEKIMPQESQINEPMTIAINIRNTGSAKAKNVMLTDRLPKGARFVEAGASATRTASGDVCWQLGDLGINEERAVELCIIPTAEGEIGSVATATFSVDASSSTRVTKPGLKLEVSVPGEEHLVGGTLSLEILISNPGTGIARNIMIEEWVPDGLSHQKGKKLAATFGDLKPNEQQRLKLTLNCDRAGEMTNYLVAKGEGDLMVESKIPITVLAPSLTLGIEGPKNRYLERKATYLLQVANPGTATTRDIQLVAKLSRGIDFVSTDSMGAYDPETHTVHWRLEALPSQQSGVIELVTLPREIGEHKIEFVGHAKGALQAANSHEVSVDGIASLGFEIANRVDPVELGREAEYEVRVFNRGTKASTNVAMRVQLPDGMRFVAAEGPTQYRVSGAVIDFNNLSQVEPREEKTYVIRAQCLTTGEQRVVVKLQSDEMESPVTKEENTNVYGDE